MRPAAERNPLSPRARVLLPLLLLALAVVSWHRYGIDPPREHYAVGGSALGTTWSVKVADEGLSQDQERAIAQAAEASIARVDELMSTWRTDSELSRFNAHTSGAAFVLSPQTVRVLEIAQRVSALSNGAFDVTVSPLVAAWGFGAGAKSLAPQPPPAQELARLRGRVGYQRLVLDPAAGTLAKTHPDVEADLSAVAKGFAVDEVARALSARGFTSYLVEIGGELRGAGLRRDGEPWRVAIEEPDVEGRRIHRVVALRDASMATSGDYRSYYEAGGRRISHTIDPRTGEPIAHRLASVSVVHPEAAVADAWATALHVLGPEAGYSLAEAQGLAAYFIVRQPAEAGEESGSFRAEMTKSFLPWLVPEAPE